MAHRHIYIYIYMGSGSGLTMDEFHCFLLFGGGTKLKILDCPIRKSLTCLNMIAAKIMNKYEKLPNMIKVLTFVDVVLSCFIYVFICLYIYIYMANKFINI